MLKCERGKQHGIPFEISNYEHTYSVYIIYNINVPILTGWYVPRIRIIYIFNSCVTPVRSPSTRRYIYVVHTVVCTRYNTFFWPSGTRGRSIVLFETSISSISWRRYWLKEIVVSDAWTLVGCRYLSLWWVSRSLRLPCRIVSMYRCVYLYCCMISHTTHKHIIPCRRSSRRGDSAANLLYTALWGPGGATQPNKLRCGVVHHLVGANIGTTINNT